MKKQKIELVFILDRSGSMAGLEDDTIGGYNAMIQKQKKEEGDVNVTTILFDDKVEILHDRVALQGMNLLTEEEYYVRGCTALLDAVGQTVVHMQNVQKYRKEEERADKVLVMITTDGYENASKEFSYDKVRMLIDHQKKNDNWEFIFVGANIDAVETAGRFGISEEYATNYVPDKKGTELNYEAMNTVISYCRSNEELDRTWKEKVERDYESRKRS